MFNFLNNTGRLPFEIEDILTQWAQKTGRRLKKFSILNVLHRPYSVVFRIRLQFENSEAFNIYFKFYSQYARDDSAASLVQRDFETTHFWYEQFKKSRKYRVIEPLYYDDKQFVLITKESKGRSIHHMLQDFGRCFQGSKASVKLHRNVQLAGEWLHYFQAIPLQESCQPLTFKYLDDYISYRLDRILLNKKINFDNELKIKIINYLREQWKLVQEKDKILTYVHTDFSLSNVLVSDATITVLDFNKKEIGSPFKDLTRFYHQLHLFSHKPVYRKQLIENLKAAFLRGYGDERIWQHPLFKIYFMIHVINHFGKTARFWEHNFVENLYNRWVVRNTLKELHSIVKEI